MDIARPPLSLVPFPYQVRNFTSALGSVLLDVPWTAKNSIAILWFGVNDCAAAQVYTKASTPKNLVDRIMDSYFTQVKGLMDTGLRRFLFMGVPRSSMLSQGVVCTDFLQHCIVYPLRFKLPTNPSTI